MRRSPHSPRHHCKEKVAFDDIARQTNRARTFLVGAAVAGGGLLVGAGAVAARLRTIDDYVLPPRDGASSFGAWLSVGSDGAVEVVVPHQDMGQGIYSLAVLLAADGLKLPPGWCRPRRRRSQRTMPTPSCCSTACHSIPTTMARSRARRCGPSTRSFAHSAYRGRAGRHPHATSPGRSAPARLSRLIC